MSNAMPNPPPGTQGPGSPGERRRSLLVMMVVLFGGLSLMWMWRSGTEEAKAPQVDYSVFYDWVEADKVESVTMIGPTIQGTLSAEEAVDGKPVTTFETRRPEGDEELVPLLREKEIGIKVEAEDQSFALQLVLSILPWVLIIGFWIWLSRRAQRAMSGAGGPLSGVLKSRTRKFDKATSVEITFDDVAGLKSAKQDLQEIVQFLKEPERFRRLGGKVPRGVLLVGPPGTGKTLLARAVAGESGVPFYTISASEFIEMFVGVGAARVRDLFAEAKKNAPAIIFIDEIDAVGRSRGAGLGGGHDEREQTLNQLLSEMDGFDRNDLTVVLAATNRPDVLDPALLRPGRFDRRVIVDRPERDARRAILQVHTKGKPLDDDVDLERVAANTPGFSGADLANLVNEAALGATRRGAEAIAAADFSEAYDKIVLGDPRETVLSAEEKHRVAVHEAGHAVVAHYSPHAEGLDRVSIIPRGMALGVTQQTPSGERHLMTQPQIESRLRVLMGGYAAERTILGDISTGAGNDLKEATALAQKMVAHFGMSKAIGPVYHDHQAEHPFLGQRLATETGTSDATVHAIESETRKILAAASEEAAEIITENRARYDRLVEALLDRESLEKDELFEILGEAVEAPDAAPAPHHQEPAAS
jgi:cell division protease FtsH